LEPELRRVPRALELAQEAAARRQPRARAPSPARTARFETLIPSLLDGSVPLDATAQDVVKQYLESRYREALRTTTAEE
jgi:hypothetical protein